MLLRALEPLEGVRAMQRNRRVQTVRDLTRGPGRLTAALDIDRRLDGVDLAGGRAFRIARAGLAYVPEEREIFANLEDLKSQGKALLYTTHYMEEVERLADRIVVIDHGRVIADDTLAGLTRAGAAGSLEQVFLTLTGRSLRD